MKSAMGGCVRRDSRRSLDAARDAITNNLVTKDEGKLLYTAALSRYATALRHFSSLVVDGIVPKDF
jgi:hypothetical protein